MAYGAGGSYITGVLYVAGCVTGGRVYGGADRGGVRVVVVVRYRTDSKFL